MTSLPLAPAVAGFALGGGLIVAIGAQNAFVLRQGLRRDRIGLVVVLCTVCDWLLIGLGAGGFGALIASMPTAAALAAWLGAAFLLTYGALSFRSAMRPGSLSAEAAPAVPGGTYGLVAATLAVSLLNPHAILDTVVLIGGISAQYPAVQRLHFALGAGVASLAWFVALGLGARLLAPMFSRPSAWRVLDALVGVVMWAIAATLVAGALS